ncbi:MAG: hypothetical protein RQ741_01975 [Wenzhouxiangellaceae bacterium]|nr:hypothetical protein [Wenzhouxiangellaceae bacterium]
MGFGTRSLRRCNALGLGSGGLFGGGAFGLCLSGLISCDALGFGLSLGGLFGNGSGGPGLFCRCRPLGGSSFGFSLSHPFGFGRLCSSPTLCFSASGLLGRQALGFSLGFGFGLGFGVSLGFGFGACRLLGGNTFSLGLFSVCLGLLTGRFLTGRFISCGLIRYRRCATGNHRKRDRQCGDEPQYDLIQLH